METSDGLPRFTNNGLKRRARSRRRKSGRDYGTRSGRKPVLGGKKPCDVVSVGT